jgi:hypothetical protein
MTYTINDGGPAFPCEEEKIASFSGCPVTIKHSGMTLRDYFAAAALQGFIASGKPAQHYGKNNIAECAYDIAALMLEERNKTDD